MLSKIFKIIDNNNKGVFVLMLDIGDFKHNICIETKKHFEESTGLNNVNNKNIEDRLERI